jgi:hypothetical protein
MAIVTPEQRAAAQIEKLKANIKAAQLRMRRLEGTAARARRKLDDRRKILIGVAALAEAAKNEAFRESVWQAVRRHIVRPEERTIFEGFAPLTGKAADRDAGPPADAPDTSHIARRERESA